MKRKLRLPNELPTRDIAHHAHSFDLWDELKMLLCSCLRNQQASIFASMNSKQKKTLAAIFKDPASGTIEWAAIENLLVAAGADVIEGNGSRVELKKTASLRASIDLIRTRKQSVIRCAMLASS